ncbi:MAG: N-acetylmuramoyl-L-alanine amidase family protein, partial [Bradyrhizobium sp.]
KEDVQQAAFVVLKAPDIPSVLVETAFITNPREEKLLASDDYQGKLAASILSGVKGYFQAYRPKQQMVEATPRLTRVSTGGGALRNTATYQPAGD